MKCRHVALSLKEKFRNQCKASFLRGHLIQHSQQLVIDHNRRIIKGLSVIWMSPSTLHDLAKAGQVSALEDYLRSLDDPSEVINSRDGLKRTALHLAAWAGHCDAVALLLKQPGIQVAAPAQDGMTALHFAAMKGREDVVEKILDSGARVNGKNVKGRNALHLAAIAGERGVVSTLLKHQANVLAMDKRGNSARSLCKDVEIQEILEEAEKKAREKTKRKRETVQKDG